MDNSGVRFKLSLFNLANLVIITGCFTVAWILYYNEIITWSYQYKGKLAISLVFLVLYFLCIKAYDGFAIVSQRKMELVISQCLAALIADCLMYVIICLLHEWFAPILPLVLVVLVQFLLILLWVIVTKNWYNTATPPRRTAVLHDGSKEALHLMGEMGYSKQHDLIVTMDILDCIDANLKPLEDAEVVFICSKSGSDRDAVIDYCTARKLPFYVSPSINDMMLTSAKRIHMFHSPLLQMHMNEPSMGYAFTKRAMDLVLSLMALAVLWPFMLIIALAVKAYDRGPAFYKQTRLTKDGKEFELIKFRSMRVDAEADGIARLSTGDNDDRITPVGKVLRKLRLDELPQLLNIVRGDMSIVGPRPERPEIAAEYEKTLPEFSLRLQAKAGLTGYAQVFGKYNSTPKEKLQMDMIYISNPRILEDIRLILTTVRVLFMKESTEGFEQQTVGSGK